MEPVARLAPVHRIAAHCARLFFLHRQAKSGLLHADPSALVQVKAEGVPLISVLGLLLEQMRRGVGCDLQSLDDTLVGLLLVHQRALADRIAGGIGRDRRWGGRRLAVGGPNFVSHDAPLLFAMRPSRHKAHRAPIESSGDRQ